MAVFASQDIQDAIRRAAKELAGDDAAGIRLEIPNNLQDSLKSLEAVSYALKRKNPKMRRNVKFDDNRLYLMLDFCIDPEGGAPWRCLQPDQARAAKRKMASGDPGVALEVGADELDGLLGAGQGASGGS